MAGAAPARARRGPARLRPPPRARPAPPAGQSSAPPRPPLPASAAWPRCTRVRRPGLPEPTWAPQPAPARDPRRPPSLLAARHPAELACIVGVMHHQVHATAPRPCQLHAVTVPQHAAKGSAEAMLRCASQACDAVGTAAFEIFWLSNAARSAALHLYTQAAKTMLAEHELSSRGTSVCRGAPAHQAHPRAPVRRQILRPRPCAHTCRPARPHLPACKLPRSKPSPGSELTVCLIPASWEGKCTLHNIAAAWQHHSRHGTVAMNVHSDQARKMTGTYKELPLPSPPSLPSHQRSLFYLFWLDYYIKLCSTIWRNGKLY